MCVCTYMYIMYIITHVTIINPCDPYVSPSVNRHQVGLSELQAPLSSRLLLQYFSRLPALVVSNHHVGILILRNYANGKERKTYDKPPRHVDRRIAS